MRINHRIRAREVRVVDADGKQLGVFPLGAALKLARNQGVDLVEVAPQANPPVCRLIDYGKFCYEQAKKQKEAKKHQHANKVKEIQLRVTIDPHDFEVKLARAIDFLCEEMKVKVSLRLRGREAVHPEYAFEVINRFLQALAPYGRPDSEPNRSGRNIHVMVSPLPRHTRAPNPRQPEKSDADTADAEEGQSQADSDDQVSARQRAEPSGSTAPSKDRAGSFTNNPFDDLDVQVSQ